MKDDPSYECATRSRAPVPTLHIPVASDPNQKSHLSWPYYR